MIKNILYLILFSIIILSIYFVCLYINHKLLFLPKIVTANDYTNFCKTHKNNYLPCKFNSLDKNISLIGGLYNSEKTPSWDDKIFFYSHGNAGWIGDLIHGQIIKLLCTHGSVFIYDYRGYGCNRGSPSDIGLEKDALGAWKYVTNKVNPKNVIAIGHSLGCGVTCKMFSNLVKNNPELLPQHLILNAPFSCVKDMASHILPQLSWLSMYEFNNMTNIKDFDDKINICILHSKDDEIIPFSQAHKLSNISKSTFIEIYGGHNDQIYSPDALDYIYLITNVDFFKKF